jgi:hypothetical protein
MRKKEPGGLATWCDCPSVYREQDIAQAVARSLRRDTDREVRVVDVLELHPAECQCHDCRPF